MSESNTIQIDTGLGPIRGIERGGTQHYRGIRFAQPPVGELRFAPPVRTGDWDGVYNATRFGNRAFQPLRRTAVETSEAATEHGNGGWLYRFDIPTTVLDGRLGATHACEIAFTFNWFDSDDAALRMHEATPTNTAVARRWSDTLIQFARTGDPNRAGLPQWSPYSTAERACMMLDDECHIEHDPDGEHRGLWQS